MPNNWKIYKLGDVVNYINGGAWAASSYSSSGIPVVRVSDVNHGTVDLSNCKYLNLDFAEKYKKHKLIKDDLIVCTVGSHPSQQSSVVGGIGIVSKKVQGSYLNQNAVLLRSKDSKILDQRWLCYLGKSPIFKKHVENEARGSANQVRLAISNLLLLEFDLPPLPEQQAIASILSSLDDKIELNLQMNKTLEEMAMTLYKHWFVDFGPFRPSLEGGACKAGGSGEFVDSELGLIPEGWEVKGILEIVDLLSGGTPKTTMDEYWNGDICWVSAKDIGNGGLYINDTEKKITELGVSKSATKILPEDTVILVARGSVGKYGMIAKKMAMNQSCYGLFVKGEYSQGLVYLMFSELIEQFKRMAYGSVFDTITTSTFKSTNVVVPPTSIIENLKTQIDPLFDQLKQNVLENESLTALRDTLLPKLISGAIRVKEAEQSLASIM